MSYGNSPSSITVQANQRFTETAWAADKDTYERDGEQYVLLCNLGTTISATFNSGTLAGTPTTHFDGETCKKTITYTIDAANIGTGASITFTDEFVARDNNVGVLDDADGLLMTCLVQVNGPGGGSGSGG